jgi:hypothetical protein
MPFTRLRRREFITLFGGAAAAWPLAARAQQTGKLPHIGVLVSASPPHPFADAFWRGLHAFGYSEARTSRSSSAILMDEAIAPKSLPMRWSGNLASGWSALMARHYAPQ